MSEYDVDDPGYIPAARIELKENYKEFWFVARSVLLLTISALVIVALLPNTLFFNFIRLAVGVGIGWFLYNIGDRFYILHILTRSVNRLEESKKRLAEAEDRLDAAIRLELWGEE